MLIHGSLLAGLTSNTIMNHLDRLPDEIVLEIFKTVTPVDLISLKKSCERFQKLITDYTVRLDLDAVKVDESIQCEEDFKHLILGCKRLKQLSLINYLRYEGSNDMTCALKAPPVKEVKGRRCKKTSLGSIKEALSEEHHVNRRQSTSKEPALLLESMFNCASVAKDFANEVAVFCPLLQMLEVTGVKGLRFVLYLAKAFNRVHGKNRINEIRVYSRDNLKEVATLVIKISKQCPHLAVFKLLRRTPVRSITTNHSVIDEMVRQIAPKLLAFSTNFTNETLLRSSMTHLVNLRRLVAWTLSSPEVEHLSNHLSSLQILVLMSVDVNAVQHLDKLLLLKDLTFSLKRQTSQEDVNEAAPLFKNFLASKVGRQLITLSLVWKNLKSGGCLDYLTEYATSLRNLKLKDFSDLDHIQKILLDKTILRFDAKERKSKIHDAVQILPNLTSFSWMESNPDSTSVVNPPISLFIQDLEGQELHVFPVAISVKTREETLDELINSLFFKYTNLRYAYNPFKTFVRRRMWIDVPKTKNHQRNTSAVSITGKLEDVSDVSHSKTKRKFDDDLKDKENKKPKGGNVNE